MERPCEQGTSFYIVQNTPEGLLERGHCVLDEGRIKGFSSKERASDIFNHVVLKCVVPEAEKQECCFW